MKFESANRDDVTIITLTGRFDASAIEEFTGKTDILLKHGTKKIVIDMAQVSFIDSSGLGCLVTTFRRLQKKEYQLKLAALDAKVRSLFELTKLHRVFDIYDDVEAAAATFR